MASLAILQPDARVSARLSEALGRAHRLTVRDTWDALECALAADDIEGCVVDGDHPNPRTAAMAMARLRHRHPGLAIIACVDGGPGAGYFDLGGLGVDGLVSSTTPGNRLRNEVDLALSSARGERIARRIAGVVPEPGPACLAWAVAHAGDVTTVGMLSAAVGYSPRRLRDALRRMGLPTPARLLVWGRLLLAGARLANDHRTVEEVAFSVRYATSTSLARAMKVQTGLTPGQIAERGGIDAVCDALLPRCSNRRPPRRAAHLAAPATIAAAVASIGWASQDPPPPAAGGPADSVPPGST